MTDPTANSQTPDPTQALKIANAITRDAAKIKDVACAIMDVADRTGDDADELYALARKICIYRRLMRPTGPEMERPLVDELDIEIAP